MAHSYDRIIIHLVWGTKYFQPFLIPTSVSAICAYINGILTNLGCKVYRINAMYDHIHIVCTLPRTKSVAQIVERAKTDSTKWIKLNFRDFQAFRWQTGYGVFSVDHYALDRTINYVERQQAHHLKQPKYQQYEKQLMELLDYYGVDFEMAFFLK